MGPPESSRVVVSENSRAALSEPEADAEARRSLDQLQDLTYHAFISYRHAEPDREWAIWLHSAIERYRVPRRLVKERNLPRRVRPLFRDEEEAAASFDLSVTIKQALIRSRYLVVICSPATPASKWINEEIAFFQSLGRGDRILSLLIEGEPHESFPPQLRAERVRDEGPERPVGAGAGGLEPLAADVRLRRGESRRKQRRMAKLRILAALLGCGFDELRRRDRERRRRNLIILTPVLAVLLCGLAWLARIAVKASRDSESRGERIALLLNESRSRDTAARALSLLADDPLLSMLIAKRAFEIAPTEQAGSALRQAVLIHAVIDTQDEGDVFSDSLEFGVKGFSVSEGARLVVTFGEGNTARVWDTRMVKEGVASGGEWQPSRGQLVGMLRGHTGHILCVSMNRSGDRILTAGEDGTARLWEPTSQVISRLLSGGGEIYAWHQTREFRHSGPVRSGGLSRDGARVVTAGDDGLVKVWEADSGNLIKSIRPGPGGEESKPAGPVSLTSASFSGDGSRIVLAYNHQQRGGQVSQGVFGIVEIWDTVSWAWVKGISHSGSAHGAHFSPDGQLVVYVATYQRPPARASVWSPYELAYVGGPFSKLTGEGGAAHEGKQSIRSAVFSPNGEHVLTAGNDWTARLWDKGWKNVLTLRGHRDRINVAAYSPDGKYIITGGDDGTFIVWSADASRLFAPAEELHRIATDRAPRTLKPEEETEHISPAPTGP